MVKSRNSNSRGNKKSDNNKFAHNETQQLDRFIKLASMGKLSADTINKLYKPIDAVNRFLNLALQSIEEDSQGRQFLLESKLGIRKMSALIKRLNNYAKQIEKEIYAIQGREE